MSQHGGHGQSDSSKCRADSFEEALLVMLNGGEVRVTGTVKRLLQSVVKECSSKMNPYLVLIGELLRYHEFVPLPERMDGLLVFGNDGIAIAMAAGFGREAVYVPWDSIGSIKVTSQIASGTVVEFAVGRQRYRLFEPGRGRFTEDHARKLSNLLNRQLTEVDHS